MRPKHRRLDRIGAPPRSTADAIEAAVSASERSARLRSMSEAATLLGRDRGTLRSWAEKGMPVETEGGSGEARTVDLARVVDWLVERARVEERKRFERAPEVDGETGEKLSPADRKNLSAMRMNQQKLAMLAKILVHREPMQVAYVRALGLIRQSVMSVPERITREMAGYPEEQVRKWRLQALDQCRAALTEGAKALNDAMRALADDPEDAAEVSLDDADD